MVRYAFLLAGSILGSANAFACPPVEKCADLWTAAHDVNVWPSFYNKGKKQLAVTEIRIGDPLKTNREVNVRSPAAGWSKLLTKLPPGAFVVVDDMKVEPAQGYPQTWLRISTPAKTIARMPLSQPVPAPGGGSSSSGGGGSSEVPNLNNVGEVRNGIWWEYPVAEATGGYDAENNRTLINSWDLAVVGPSSIKLEIKKIVEDCVKASGVSAYESFKATPGEVGTRIAAAWSTFHAALPGCFSFNKIGNELIDKFEITYIRRGRWEHGLNLLFSAQNPSTEHYRRLHNLVKDKLPDPVNQLVTFYIGSQELPKVDIKIDPPAVFRDVLSNYPDPQTLERMIDAANQKDGGKQLLIEVKEEATRVGERLGSHAQKTGGQIVRAAVQLTGDAGKAIEKHGGAVVKALTPEIKDGKMRVGGIEVGLPGGGGGGGGGGGSGVCTILCGGIPCC